MIILYLDPGSGSFLVQLVIAAFAGVSIAIGANWSKLKRLLGRKQKITEPDDDEDDEQKPGA